MEKPMHNHSAKNSPIDMEKWRGIVEAWNTSGENQKAYCQRLGVSLNTFCYVRGKLMRQNKPKTQFVPLTIKNLSEEKALSPHHRIGKSQGYKLHIPASLSLEQLAKIFKLSGWNDA